MKPRPSFASAISPAYAGGGHAGHTGHADHSGVGEVSYSQAPFPPAAGGAARPRKNFDSILFHPRLRASRSDNARDDMEDDFGVHHHAHTHGDTVGDDTEHAEDANILGRTLEPANVVALEVGTIYLTVYRNPSLILTCYLLDL
jgi:hypothetical protein